MEKNLSSTTAESSHQGVQAVSSSYGIMSFIGVPKDFSHKPAF